MDNLTNQVLELKTGEKYFIIRQAELSGKTYFFCASVVGDGDEFGNEFKFFERVIDEETHKLFVKEVKDDATLAILSKNIKLN